MTGTFISDFGPVVYTTRKMLVMQEDLKLKKDFEVKAITFVVSRYPSHYELYVELYDHKQYTQLWQKDGATIRPCSSFVPVIPFGGK